MEIMKAYYDSHLKCDALLLADLFEKFGNRIKKKYVLCLSICLSAPALS